MTKAKKAAVGKPRKTTVAEFLDLSPTEEAMVELRVSLAEAVRAQRVARGLTQAQLAKDVGTSQAQIARLENGSPKVSLDQAMRVLLELSPKGIALKVGGRGKAQVKAA